MKSLTYQELNVKAENVEISNQFKTIKQAFIGGYITCRSTPKWFNSNESMPVDLLPVIGFGKDNTGDRFVLEFTVMRDNGNWKFAETQDYIACEITHYMFMPSERFIDYNLNLNDPPTFEKLIEKHSQWANETFPKSTARGAFLHAQRESIEIMQDFDNNASKKHLATEIMDYIFCLMHGAEKAGITFQMLVDAGFEKLDVNQGREWIDNGDGSYSHIKPAI